MRRWTVDFWSFVLAMVGAYVLNFLMFLSAIGVIDWRIDLMWIWQYGFLSIAFASALDGWLGRKRKG